MQDCPTGHPLSVVGKITVRWCPECARFAVKAWVAEDDGAVVEVVSPEWAWPHVLADDEFTHRTLTKHITGVANITRTLEDDLRHGRARLL